MTDTKILIVEDEAIVALDLQGWLRRLGYQSTVTALTGDEAIEFADVMRPDLIFMDIGLKGAIDGIEVAEQILASFAVKIVFLTAYSDTVTRQRAAKLAPAAFLTKPFSVEAVQNAIQTALNLRK